MILSAQSSSANICSIEIDGGIWVMRASQPCCRFKRRPRKYLEAGLLGWQVFRLGPDQITIENVARLKCQVRREIDRFSTESTSPLNAQLIDYESTRAKTAAKKVES